MQTPRSISSILLLTSYLNKKRNYAKLLELGSATGDSHLKLELETRDGLWVNKVNVVNVMNVGEHVENAMFTT